MVLRGDQTRGRYLYHSCSTGGFPTAVGDPDDVMGDGSERKDIVRNTASYSLDVGSTDLGQGSFVMPLEFKAVNVNWDIRYRR